MKLLTDELRAQLPLFYAQENEDDAMICDLYFTPKHASEILGIKKLPRAKRGWGQFFLHSAF